MFLGNPSLGKPQQSARTQGKDDIVADEVAVSNETQTQLNERFE